MKKIFRIIKHWRYSRLYIKLFLHYVKNFNYAAEAAEQADLAFFIVTGKEYKEYL